MKLSVFLFLPFTTPPPMLHFPRCPPDRLLRGGARSTVSHRAVCFFHCNGIPAVISTVDYDWRARARARIWQCQCQWHQAPAPGGCWARKSTLKSTDMRTYSLCCRCRCRCCTGAGSYRAEDGSSASARCLRSPHNSGCPYHLPTPCRRLASSEGFKEALALA
jgi:hypothetical protein